MVIKIPISELQPGDKINGKTVTVVQRNKKYLIVFVDFSDGSKRNFEWDTEMLVTREIERIQHGLF